jgi:hypothetical protein
MFGCDEHFVRNGYVGKDIIGCERHYAGDDFDRFWVACQLAAETVEPCE